MFFITTAFADSAASSPNPIMQLIPIAAIFVVFYFLMIRPQNKKAQEHKKMLQELKVGDVVVTNSGIIGRISKMNENDIQLEVETNQFLYVLKNAISSLYEGTLKFSVAPSSDSKRISSPKAPNKQKAAPAKKEEKKAVKA